MAELTWEQIVSMSCAKYPSSPSGIPLADEDFSQEEIGRIREQFLKDYQKNKPGFYKAKKEGMALEKSCCLSLLRAELEGYKSEGKLEVACALLKVIKRLEGVA